VDFRLVPVTELARRVRDKEVSARELTAAALARIEELNPSVNAFVAVDGDRALEQAAAIDQIVATGGDAGPLAGVPCGVKDSQPAAGYVTSHGSALHTGDPPAVHDSVMVSRLRAGGAVVVGKTNLPEFAWSASTTNATFGPTRNPWNLEHSAGGSSGGSAAALAAGMVPLATGSDGGGSIRIPSACCGLSGVKPSHGRVPNGGGEPPGWLDLSTNGPMARRIADIVTALDVVVGPEPTDLSSLPRPEANWRAVLAEPHVPARVAWSPNLGYAPVDPDVAAACERALGVLESLGAEVVEVDAVFDVDPVADWLTLVGVCMLRSLDPYRDDPDWTAVDPMLRYVVDSARQVSAVDVVRVFDTCHRMNLRLVELFHDVRLLVTPTTAAPAPPLALGGSGMLAGQVDPNWVRLTYPFNMTRSPAATVCAGLTPAGIPVGLQLIGPSHADLVVLRSAAALEAALGFDELAPVGG
jgi:Asp-tRNA(Asn)/Glu-tRNA(Gln) amidotransferase A subunit family amidase